MTICNILNLLFHYVINCFTYQALTLISLVNAETSTTRVVNVVILFYTPQRPFHYLMEVLPWETNLFEL